MKAVLKEGFNISQDIQKPPLQENRAPKPPAPGARKGGRPKGLKRMTHFTHGARCKDWHDAYNYWQRKKPEIAHFIDDLAERFRLELGWQPSDPRVEELKYLGVLVCSRNLINNKILEDDFKNPVRDPRTGRIIRFRAHYLFRSVIAFDIRVQQKLKDFGLISSPLSQEKSLIPPNNKNKYTDYTNEK